MEAVRALDAVHRSWDPDALLASIGRSPTRCAACRAEADLESADWDRRLERLLARHGAILAAAASETLRLHDLAVLDATEVPPLPPME